MTTKTATAPKPAAQQQPAAAPPPLAEVAKRPKTEEELKREAQLRATNFWLDKAKPAIKAALPNIGLTAERFARVALTCVTQNPMLLECDPKTIAVGVIRSAQLGLSLDPVLGEAYLIPRWNGKKKRMEANFQRGYRGVAKLIRRTGELSGIRGDVVHEKDKFMRTATGDIFHEPADADRGARKGAYVTMYFKDGFVLAHYMPLTEIYAIRDRYSEGYKAFMAKKILSNPWDPQNPIAEKWMLIKTVLFQAAHLAPMETEAGQQLVKEAIAEELPADEAMDELASELFEGDEPIEVTRTAERLSKTDEMAKQLESSQSAANQQPSGSQPAAPPATTVEKGGEAPIVQTTGEEVDQERATVAQRVVVARDNVFGKIVEGDRFIAGKTDGKYKTLDELVRNGSITELSGILREINSFANQRDQVK